MREADREEEGRVEQEQRAENGEMGGGYFTKSHDLMGHRVTPM